MNYPSVWGEGETLDLVRSGMSLARYGDGEFNLCRGLSIPCQSYHPTLAQRLREILRASGLCMVGIPNLQSDTPKAPFWTRHLRGISVADLLAERAYGSAFMTRPDSAPWIDTPDYWSALESLWVGMDVTLVRGSERSLTKADLIGAGHVTEIVAPTKHAWAVYEELLSKVGTPARALLCLGPTATVMAVDLCARGVHAIDLGHIGMFLKKHRNHQPMMVTAMDKVS